ncbi:hypothetical protein COJ67_21855 [Bacillus thuringiensis]|uniref:hypothetical protein n=1 Tax=Bacillus thuringiensis TaxID=1428 RepID=UPI000BFA71DB|nr:hypothetical protein [Bacillus thuringiensis]PFN84844.1 hypothetical protein COJ67_21855 [Bacillus thuringiensis]PGX94918.1 hypothetical protein COE41_23805 [Bacillus thuringiensis]
MTTVMTLDIATEIENTEIDMLSSRLERLQTISGNPMQVQMKKFGSATAFSSKIIAGPAFNTVKGITNADAIDAIISYYESLQIPCRFEITPAQGTAELFQYLSQKGFYQSSFHTALYSIPRVDPSLLPANISVRQLKENEFHILADIYVRGFNMPSFTKDGVRQNNMERAHMKIAYTKSIWTAKDI